MEMAKKHREIEMALAIAKIRDRVQWGCGLYSFLFLGATTYFVKHKDLPKPLIPPLVVGGFALLFFGDMAYGNKLRRVANEAEHILKYERDLLIPPPSTPLYKFYEEDVKKIPEDEKKKVLENRVSTVWPGFIYNFLPRQN